MKRIKRKIIEISPQVILDIYFNTKNMILSQKVIDDIEIYAKANNLDYIRELAFLKKKKMIVTFPYEYTQKYNWKNINVVYDNIKKLPYVLHDKKKLYFPPNFTEIEIKKLYNSLICEQDKDSPHKYFDQDMAIDKEDIFLDVGAAEGLISLEIIDKVKAVYLFENEELWKDALAATFEPWKNKVKIVSKYVSNKNSFDQVTLDRYLFDQERSQTYFLKMDIEGAEGVVLENIKPLLKQYSFKIACCTYHNEKDAEQFKQLFEEIKYSIRFSKGYMITQSHEPRLLRAPYFRKAMLYAKK